MHADRMLSLTFLSGIKAALPIVIGYLPAGITFGILARGADIYLGDVFGFSGIVFAGASQYMAIELLQSGAFYLEIITATFLLNFRHFLMSASLSQKINENRKPVLAALAYGVTDETFAVASSEERPLTTSYLVGLELSAWLTWNVGSLAGFFAGTYIPDIIESSMGVALYALFAGLLLPQVKKQMRLLTLALSAGLLHWIVSEIQVISRGWAFVLAVICAGVIGASWLSLAPQRKKGS